MVDALVGLPQLLLDHALARIAPTSLAGQIRPDISKEFCEEVPDKARRLLRPDETEASKDDTGYRGGVPDFRGCGQRQRQRYVRQDQGPAGKGSGIGHRLEAISAAGGRGGIPRRRIQPKVPDRGDLPRQRSRLRQSLIGGINRIPRAILSSIDNQCASIVSQ